MSDLHEAAHAGDVDAVRAILAQDPYRVTRRQDGKITPLHRAAAEGHAEVVELLLRASAAPGSKDYGGSTPLHAAARGGHLESVRALLAHGAKPSPMNEAGDTPLHEAARGGHLEIVRLLLEHGADPNAAGQCGGTPLHAAAGAGRLEEADLLLRHGALANGRSSAHSQAWTPWNEADKSGQAAVADLLLHHGGADKAAGPIDAPTAAARGYDGRLEVLLDGDPALVHARDVLHKRTPLHWAAANGRASIAQMLLARGADRGATDKRGLTPAELAAAGGYPELAQRLQPPPR
jgi:ankyrin repeat protein